MSNKIEKRSYYYCRNRTQPKLKYRVPWNRYFQNMDTTNTGKERDVTATQCGPISTKSICSLPEWYTEVPPFILRNTAECTPTVTVAQRDQRPSKFDEAKKEEDEWLHTVEEVTRATENSQFEEESPV